MTIVSANTCNALRQSMGDMTWTNTMDDACGADGKPQGRSAGAALHWRYTGSSTDSKQRAFVPFQGRILAEYYGGSPGGTLFDHPEELGSLSTAMDYATSHSQERLFYPFGEMWTGSDLYSLNSHQTFGKLPDYDNDSNSDLYNTLNRHYTPMGRWLSPDPGGANAVHLDDPQTWNMYAYVRNNPTTLTDPTGLCVEDACVIEGLVALGVATTLYIESPAGQESIRSLEKLVTYTGTRITNGVQSLVNLAKGEKAEDRTTANPDRPGTLGKPDHQQTAKEEADRMGGRQEVTIPTPGGAKDSRRADAAQTDEGGNVKSGGEVVQVYRPTPAGNIPQREQDAAKDIENATGVKPTMVPVRPVKPPCPSGGTCQ